MFISETFNKLTSAQRDLVMYESENYKLSHTSKNPILAKLAKDAKAGTYEKEKAVDLWTSHVNRVAKSFHSQNGDTETPWHKAYPTADRKATASYWEDHYRNAFKEAVINDDGTVVIESIVNPREKLGMDILESILDKKPVALKEHFAAFMKVITDEIVAEMSNEMAKTLFSKENLDATSRGLTNG